MKTGTQVYVPYTGNMETGISAARAGMLSVVETDEVLNQFQTQLEKITNAGIAFDRARPAVAGGIILECENPQAVYDAVFGTSQPQRSAKVVDFAAARQERSESVISSIFAQSAEKYPILKNFAMAARSTVSANIDRAPDMQFAAA